MKMSWRRVKSPGWAAFDLKQQQKQGLEFEAHNDPPSSSNIAPLLPSRNLAKNDDPTVRSFSSVLLPSAKFPNRAVNNDIEDTLRIGNSCSNQSGKVIDKHKENDVLQSYEKLKELHCWADKNLIEDIMAAVNYDIDKASALLVEMVSPYISEESKETKFEDSKYNTDNILSDKGKLPENIGLYPGEATELAEPTCVLEDGLIFQNKELLDDHVSCGKMLLDDNVHSKLIWENLRFIPVEPEWEEDDIYLIHRKDAIKMMRSASRHSKAANDAYLRGDHLSAQQFSIKAQEEWNIAEKLNAKAAKEIYSIRNCKNDEWKLDLHGLHAAEAVQVLQEHLQKIECLVRFNRSAYSSRDIEKAGVTYATSLESLNRMDMKKSDKQQESFRQRASLLEVITGRGNHSRGQAALPTAIRSFLGEKGYHYNEARPGVITVRPKFRQL